MPRKMNYPFFCYYRETGFLWFRILGYGLVIANRVKNPPLFSERMGLTKRVIIGNYSIKTLTP